MPQSDIIQNLLLCAHWHALQTQVTKQYDFKQGAARVNKTVKLSLCLTKHYAIKMYGGVGVQIHVILTSALDGNGQLHAPAALPFG
jgi:hypothetical protein